MKLVTRLGSLVVGLVVCAACCGADWITAPSYYSHDPQSGQRVDQYTPIGPFYTFARTDYLQSGYRHTRSSIQAGLSVDHMHIVEEWGRPVRPYGEWQFPFRPFSVPYSMWGPPFAGMQSPWFGPFGGGRGGAGAGWAGDMDPYGRQQPPPYQDDRYAPYRSRPRGGGGDAGPLGNPFPPGAPSGREPGD